MSPKIVRFFRSIYRDNDLRKERRRSISKDLWLYARNRLLQPLEWLLVRRQSGVAPPLIFIVGAPRSGTTLLYQLMCRQLEVAFVTNYVAQYWLAPVLATIVQKNLRGLKREKGSMTSTLGSTQGPDAPHEFSYFWQFWTEFGDTDHLTHEELDAIDWHPIERELHALGAWEGYPVVSKAITFTNYHIPHLAKVFATSRFIHIHRETRYVVQSILEARKLRYGSENVWWSIRPRDVEAWHSESPVKQVMHQVLDCREAIASGMAELEDGRGFELSYEALCQDPSGILAKLAEFCGTGRRSVAEVEHLTLQCGNVKRLNDDVIAEIDRLIAES